MAVTDTVNLTEIFLLWVADLQENVMSTLETGQEKALTAPKDLCRTGEFGELGTPI